MYMYMYYIVGVRMSWQFLFLAQMLAIKFAEGNIFQLEKGDKLIIIYNVLVTYM